MCKCAFGAAVEKNGADLGWQVRAKRSWPEIQSGDDMGSLHRNDVGDGREERERGGEAKNNGHGSNPVLGWVSEFCVADVKRFEIFAHVTSA